MTGNIYDALQMMGKDAHILMKRFISQEKALILRSEVWDIFHGFCTSGGRHEHLDSQLGDIMAATQEAVIDSGWLYIAVRPRVARWQFIRINHEHLAVEVVTVARFLELKERLILGCDEDFTLEIDLGPFGRGFPRLKESRSIGRGVEFLNRKLSSELFQDLGKGDKRILDFLRVHQCEGEQLMLNGKINSVAELRNSLRLAEDYLVRRDKNNGWDQVSKSMKGFGFEQGWGRTVEKMRHVLTLLSDILEAPDPANLERFLGSIPMIFNIVILSPHGYFGQKDVLGLPDTGGQVVYILDQVKAIEKEMRNRLQEQGIELETKILVVTRLIPEAGDTTCDQRLEDIEGTEHAKILRVPFRYENGKTVPHWISRFEIWPYIERFVVDVEKEIGRELGCKPDLVVGNYSDGNLAASLLARKLKVTQCNIAHALEKTKYLYSDLYWKEMEEKYHFSCQFTADLIAMNYADFIITSTYQEIAGQSDSVGQYESYGSFTMPGLYRVVNGIDMFDPKFNIVSPGADSSIYYSYGDTDRRLVGLHDELNDMVFGGNDGFESRGIIAEPDMPLLFTMARLDRIKNITGFVEWYAKNERLRTIANLLVIGGRIDPDNSFDSEERDQIQLMHKLFDEHGLNDQVRWLGVHMEKAKSGELYRMVADKGGAFVQPALFEAFGLTVVEAMTSGLPTFATCYGGPLEIIEHGVSGFHINPNYGMEATDLMADFLEQSAQNPQRWINLSDGGMNRVKKRYTWELYAEKMMTLSRVYGFWKFVTNLERDETRRYLESLYGLLFRELAKSVPQ